MELKNPFADVFVGKFNQLQIVHRLPVRNRF